MADLPTVHGGLAQRRAGHRPESPPCAAPAGFSAIGLRRPSSAAPRSSRAPARGGPGCVDTPRPAAASQDKYVVWSAPGRTRRRGAAPTSAEEQADCPAGRPARPRPAQTQQEADAHEKAAWRPPLGGWRSPLCSRGPREADPRPSADAPAGTTWCSIPRPPTHTGGGPATPLVATSRRGDAASAALARRSP